MSLVMVLCRSLTCVSYMRFTHHPLAYNMPLAGRGSSKTSAIPRSLDFKSGRVWYAIRLANRTAAGSFQYHLLMAADPFSSTVLLEVL